MTTPTPGSTNMPLMQCGHVAQGHDGNGNPVCVICVGFHHGARVVHDNPPDLTGRRSRCTYYRSCGTECDSTYGLPFFEHKPGFEYDRHYCGCMGWD